MTSLLPLASYNLALEPFVPTQAIESDLPVTIHITLAALDPEAIDDDEQPSTLRILKSSVFNNLTDDFDEDDLDEEELAALEAAADDEDDELDDEEEEEEEEEEDDDDDEEEEPKEDDENDEEEGDEDDEDNDEDDVEEYIICTLSPKSQYQQTLDLTIAPDEEVYFVVTGSYPIHISGNYVEHPYDNEDDFSDDDEEDEEDFSEDEYDLTPDEDEILEEGDFDIDDLDDDEDIEGRIEELVEEEKKQSKKSKKEKENKKRAVEEVAEAKETKETKKQKKAKAEAAEEKNVQFNKELEQGPTKEKKPVVKTLAGGVVIEDRTTGKGPTAKNGSKVGVRYIGKLKNGSVFDKNTSGKPFQFHLGKGEVIKGWDIGVQGMAVGGERRIVIPAPFAYGKKKLPGIPANSELTFDVKLVSLK